MPKTASIPLHVFYVFAIVAIALASFELGALWQARTGKSLQATAPAAVSPVATNHSNHTSPIVRKSIRAEFNPQSALLIGANDLVRFHQTAFKEIIRAIQGRIPIIGFVNNEEEAELGQDLLNEAGVPGTAVSFIVQPLDSMWIRDFGPQFARWSDGTVKVIHAVYDPDVKGPREHDDELSDYIGRVLNLKVERMPLTLEGGNILSNGDGLMVTSTEVMERPENRGYTLQQIGSLLQAYLGCEAWVYLRPLEGEPTGHIDFCLTFLRRNLVVVGQYDKAYDPVNAGILDRMAETLAGQKTSMGPMVVERIPMPPRTKEGDWRSYCNVLLVNGIILMPSYSGVDPAMEEEARKTYARLMPTWKIAPINSDTLIKKRGVLHCIGSTVPGYVNALPLIGEAL
jgi:agmatine deiminase